MRSFQVIMFSLCVLGGLYLLVWAPAFFLPDRWNPAMGRQFDPLAARLLGGALLAIAWSGAGYLRRFYYGDGTHRLLEPAAQRHHFVIMILALTLLGSAFLASTPAANPDHHPSSHNTP